MQQQLRTRCADKRRASNDPYGFIAGANLKHIYTILRGVMSLSLSLSPSPSPFPSLSSGWMERADGKRESGSVSNRPRAPYRPLNLLPTVGGRLENETITRRYFGLRLSTTPRRTRTSRTSFLNAPPRIAQAPKTALGLSSRILTSMTT